MNTEEAKDFLVEQTTEQAALEQATLSDIEKRMMYFTESDPASCDNPVELNDEFEAEYETAEYEIKISRLLHHAYKRLKNENPERKHDWDDAIRTLRKGDHYFLVLWDIKLPSEHRIRDFFTLLGTGLLVAAGFGVAIIWAVERNIPEERFNKYLMFAVIMLLLIGTGTFRTIYRVAVVWFHSRRTEGREPN